MLKFAAVSTAVHVMILAPWPAPMLPDYRSDTVLSVGLTTLDPASQSTDIRTAITSHESQRDSQRERNLETPTRIRTVAKLHINKMSRKPKDVREDVIVMETAAPIPFSEPSKTARFTATLQQRRRLDKPMAMSPPVKFEQPVITANTTTGGETKSASAHIRGKLQTNLARDFSHPFPEASKTARFTATLQQRPPLDKPIAMSTTVKFKQTRTPASTTTGDATKSANAHIRGKLQTNLARYFSYPPIARRRGWQGQVQIGFRLQPDGKLTDIYVARSSGYRLLDKSAIKALRQVEPLAEAATLLKGKSIDMELPIIYKLEQP